VLQLGCSRFSGVLVMAALRSMDTLGGVMSSIVRRTACCGIFLCIQSFVGKGHAAFLWRWVIPSKMIEDLLAASQHYVIIEKFLFPLSHPVQGINAALELEVQLRLIGEFV
jgi:hypothetical protein